MRGLCWQIAVDALLRPFAVSARVCSDEQCAPRAHAHIWQTMREHCSRSALAASRLCVRTMSKWLDEGGAGGHMGESRNCASDCSVHGVARVLGFGTLVRCTRNLVVWMVHARSRSEREHAHRQGRTCERLPCHGQGALGAGDSACTPTNKNYENGGAIETCRSAGAVVRLPPCAFVYAPACACARPIRS